MKNLGRKSFLAVPLIAIFLSLVLSSIPVNASSGVSISDFNVTPALAEFGTTATGTVTVQNLDTTSQVSLTVTVADTGVNVANRQLTVPAGGSATVQIQFKTVTGPPHCYSASTSPVASSKGYCETSGTGGQLGGSPLSVNTVALLAPYLVVAAVAAGAFSTILFSRRRKN